MDTSNDRGQILIEAAFITTFFVVVLLTVLSQVKQTQERNQKYGISKKINFEDKFKK